MKLCMHAETLCVMIKIEFQAAGNHGKCCGLSYCNWILGLRDPGSLLRSHSDGEVATSRPSEQSKANRTRRLPNAARLLPWKHRQLIWPDRRPGGLRSARESHAR